ncbi:MAG: 5-(carboxyamino)imidazole ribonucleotide synthase [Chloroflexi bacterium]|nr:MAG: 5-(carboxyamino)imidazole ribonucleotide synthase [Chloroflexota bacterium]
MNQILPPSTIGILGSGQLGRMLALSARQMGYRVHVLSPDHDSPTGQIADKEYTASYDNLDTVREFARGVDVVTYEFENVPAATAAACEAFAPLRPGAKALHISQNRLREKQFFAANGLPVTQFTAVSTLTDLQNGLTQIGTPAILKTATAGYDGKGQQLIRQPEEAEAAWEKVGKRPSILEGYVDFERELSVVAARGIDGSFVHYDVIENEHRNHILDVSVAPANLPPSVAADAIAIADTVMAALDAVGVLTVELFLISNGRFRLNEIAPRPHNSGHLTNNACVTGQFEQQLRAICGLPLGDTSYRRPAAMANLLGDLWPQTQSAKSLIPQPNWTPVFAHPDLHLHLYGKDDARPGRKMGHLTALANSTQAAKTLVQTVRNEIGDVRQR